MATAKCLPCGTEFSTVSELITHVVEHGKDADHALVTTPEEE